MIARTPTSGDFSYVVMTVFAAAVRHMYNSFWHEFITATKQSVSHTCDYNTSCSTAISSRDIRSFTRLYSVAQKVIPIIFTLILLKTLNMQVEQWF